MPRGSPRVGRLWMRRQLRWRRRTRSSFASLDSSTRSARSPPAQVRQNRHRPAKVWRRRRRRRRRRRQATARWRLSCSKATKCWTAADFGRSSTPLLHRRSVLRYHAHAMHTPVRTPCTHHATRRVRAGARGGNVGHGPELSSRRPDDLVHHTRAAREAGRMRCLFGRAVSRGGDGAGADRCAARARRWRPLPVRLAPHTTRPPARGLARGAVGWHGPSAALRVPPPTALTGPPRGCLPLQGRGRVAHSGR